MHVVAENETARHYTENECTFQLLMRRWKIRISDHDDDDSTIDTRIGFSFCVREIVVDRAFK